MIGWLFQQRHRLFKCKELASHWRWPACFRAYFSLVGRPIMCKRIPRPTEEEIDNLREEYKQELREMFNRYRPLYDPTAEDIRFFWGKFRAICGLFWNFIRFYFVNRVCMFNIRSQKFSFTKRTIYRPNRCYLKLSCLCLHWISS